MLRILTTVLLSLFIQATAFSAVNNVTEEDGSPSGYPWKVKFSNGSLTDNADGTFSVAAGAGTGTVTSVSVATANGFSGTVATATTTPAITIIAGAIVPTSVAASGTVTGSNLSGTNTGDQTTVTGNAGTATALAADGANCTAGNYPLGVDASGAVQDCTAVGAGSGDITDVGDTTTGAAFNALNTGTTLTFSNATSGTIALTPVAGALGTVTLSLPAATDTLVGKATTDTLTNKTLTTPVVSGTPAAAGALGYNTTQAMQTTYGGITAVVAPIHGTIATGVGTETLTNSVDTDQDFTSMYTFPANSIYTNKVYRVTVLAELVTGVSTANLRSYLKIGTTKIYQSSSTNHGNSVTRSAPLIFLIFGREAAGAAANVSGGLVDRLLTNNNVDQPIALATNGTLTINYGVSWSATGSTETVEQQGFIIEELN